MSGLPGIGAGPCHDERVMSFPQRRTSGPGTPGGPVRTHRDLSTLLTRVREGDLVVLDRRDLDAGTARALADRKPWAVLNAAEFISGRFANLGPRLLCERGILLLEGDPAHVRALTDGTVLRFDGSTLYDGPVVAADVRVLSGVEIEQRMEDARTGMAAQLDSFAHTASEFLRREEPLLLHGNGAPPLRAATARRTVVVVGPDAALEDLRKLRAFLREQKPVVIGVDRGGEVALRIRRRLDVLVLTGDGSAATDRALARSREVVLAGTGDAVRRTLERRNLPVHSVQTRLPGTDLGILLAHLGAARLIVPIGAPRTLEEFLDRSRNDQASNVLTRLRVEGSLVEADSIPLLYTGKVRRRDLALAGVAALAALAFSLAATPIGHDHWHSLEQHLPASWGLGR
jgi:uncharacterized membrane-anchored protein